MSITNETIVKAAKAAGLDVRETFAHGINTMRIFYQDKISRIFNPKHNDTDSAMIMDGAEIDIIYLPKSVIGKCEDIYQDKNGDRFVESQYVMYSDDKRQARRDAVILCAAAKWDAMNGGGK